MIEQTQEEHLKPTEFSEVAQLEENVHNLETLILLVKQGGLPLVKEVLGR